MGKGLGLSTGKRVRPSRTTLAMPVRCHCRRMLAEQLHDESGAEDDDDLNEPLGGKDPVERRHVSRCPLL